MVESKKDPFRIAVLISGRGSNMIALHEAIARGEVGARIECVISSSSTAAGVGWAQNHGLPVHVVDFKSFADEASLAAHLIGLLQQHGVQLVVLAGFLKKIPDDMVRAFANRIINIHPALLPAFGGQGMYGRHVHAAVLEYGCKVSGATVHIVTHEYDAGPPVLQECLQVRDEDTPETLAARILKVEHRLLPKAVDLFARDRIRISGRRVKILKN